MGDLRINKSAFSICCDALNALADRLNEASAFTLELSGDTSLTGEKELECYNELLKMKDILADLAKETAKDVKLTMARYVLADQ